MRRAWIQWLKIVSIVTQLLNWGPPTAFGFSSLDRLTDGYFTCTGQFCDELGQLWPPSLPALPVNCPALSSQISPSTTKDKMSARQLPLVCCFCGPDQSEGWWNSSRSWRLYHVALCHRNMFTIVWALVLLIKFSRKKNCFQHKW